MFHALSWFVVVSLLAFWSLVAWALHALAVWTLSNAGSLSGLASGAGTMKLPDGLAPWIPPELAQWAAQWLASFGPVVDTLLQAAPALAGGVTVASWVIWGIGSLLLVLLGAGLHLLIGRRTRRHDGGHGPTGGSPLAAG